LRYPTIALAFSLAPFVIQTGCTATTVSPPLSSHGSTTPHGTFGDVYLSSGRFHRPHRVIGVVQLTQSGYKWWHEVEVVDDARPDSILFKIGKYARSFHADGVQHLTLIDLDPQTPADTGAKKIDSAIRMERAVREGRYANIAGEGTHTRWEVRGELVQFVD
jgi:hypothetical protein